MRAIRDKAERENTASEKKAEFLIYWEELASVIINTAELDLDIMSEIDLEGLQMTYATQARKWSSPRFEAGIWLESISSEEFKKEFLLKLNNIRFSVPTDEVKPNPLGLIIGACCCGLGAAVSVAVNPAVGIAIGTVGVIIGIILQLKDRRNLPYKRRACFMREILDTLSEKRRELKALVDAHL